MTNDTPAPAPMTAERLEVIRGDVRRNAARWSSSAIVEMYLDELLASHDALTARVAELEQTQIALEEDRAHFKDRALAAEAQLKEAREKALEEAAKLCDGQITKGNYIRWSCWNPNGDLGTHTSEASLARTLAAGIRAIKDTSHD